MSEAAALQGLASETLADRAYTALREAIISGELAAGEKITERNLAERLAVSPTPVREALRRLEQDRLIERTGLRSVQVVDVDSQTAGEIRLIEGNLRAVAARLAAANANADQLQRMSDLLDESDAEVARLHADTDAGAAHTATDLIPLLELTREFHQSVNEAANNPVLLRLLALVDGFRMTHVRRRLADELATGGAASEAMGDRYSQHRELFEAVRAGNAADAERLMRDHGDLDA